MVKPSPYQIAAFARVAQEGSFSKAAKRLGVSQSSVTQQISKLEQTIGVPLFIRRRAGLELTVAGRDLSEVSRRYVMLEDAIRTRVSHYQNLTTGHLDVIATTPRPALPIIRQFNQYFPNISVNLSLHSQTVCLQMMHNREADIGVIIEPPEHDEFTLLPCRTTTYKATMARSHRLANRARLSLSELCEDTIVMPEDASFTQTVVHEQMTRLGLRFQRILKMQTFPLVKECVLHGLGISFFLDDSTFPASTLAMVPVDELDAVYQDFLVIPNERAELQIIKEFIKSVEQ